MKWYFQSGILLCALLLAGCATPGGRTFDFGFAAARLPDIRGETHFTAAGPFYESAERKHDFRYLGVRPLFSRVSSPADARWSLDVLWPLAAARGWNDDFVWRFLLAYGMRYGDEQSERYRTWLLPVWFQGRTAAGEDYFAVFPLGGKICEFLGRDRISFVLFPLYARSVINEVRTTSILWPVGSRAGRCRRRLIVMIRRRVLGAAMAVVMTAGCGDDDDVSRPPADTARSEVSV
ncbi:MAG TPA: hypothetical protein PKM67_10655, partial [Kiritimatiellia bacterium]|nr:hypothetical protein [Kiritimatiellia bacterium]